MIRISAFLFLIAAGVAIAATTRRSASCAVGKWSIRKKIN